MPFNPTIRDALGVVGNKPAPSVRDAIEGEHVWTPASGQNVQDLVPNLIRTIAHNGKLFVRDDADTTTAHDGIACIVTQGGVRFKATDYGAGALIRRFAVLSIISTPPASPAVGDVHIVGIGATGVWAAKDGKVAHRTSAGWVYITPKVYDEAHVAAVLQIYHFNASSLWVAGIPALTLAVAQVHFSNLRHGLGQAVENQTTNTPPPSPSDGVAYIIGPSPTGAWSGHALKFTEWRNGAWEIYTPQIGWTVYDKNLGEIINYSSSGWNGASYAYFDAQTYAKVFPSVAATPQYGFSATIPPTTSNSRLIMSALYQPKRAGTTIEVDCFLRSFSSTGFSVGLFVGGATNAVDWSHESKSNRFIYSNPDTSPKTFNIRFSISTPTQVNIDALDLVVREQA